ncbi:MAG TPA: hypothetical protein VJN95_10040 [Gemmatimonadales bacterium]|nr:hypothetical protein [Gemmatimonadales bacterium]
MSTAQPTTQPAAERRAAEAELRRLVAKFTPSEARLAGAVRRWLRKRLPTAFEVVYEYRDCFVTSWSPSERGYEGVFAIRGSEEGVRLYFNAGKGLPDPEKLLRGSGGKARYIDVEGASTLARPAVAGLFKGAMARSRVPFARTGRGPVVLSPALGKKGKRGRA